MSKPRITPIWSAIDNASDHLKWYNNKGTLQLFFIISIIYAGEALDAWDGTLLSGLQALPAWKRDVGYPNASRLGLLSCARALGGLVFGPLGAWAGDKYGRRWCLRFFGFAITLGTVLAVIAGSGGAGNAVGLQVSLVMLQEVAHPRTRHIVAGLYDASYSLGQVAASWTVFGCAKMVGSSWGWRIPTLLQLVGAFYILIATFFIPETPRFLLDKGRDEDALNFLVKYHGNSNPEDKLVLVEFAEMKRTLTAERALGQQTWKEALKGKGNLKRLAVLALVVTMTQLNGARITQVYYTVQLRLVGITKTQEVTGIGAGKWGFVAQIAGTYAVTRFKRRSIIMTVWPALLIVMIGLCVATQQFIASDKKNTHAGIASIACIWLFQGANNMAAPILYSYPAEILPYVVRGRFMGLWTVLYNCYSIYSNYVNSVALASITWRYYIVYIVFIALQLVLAYFFFVETAGYSLEEVAIAFEGETAAVVAVDHELGLDGMSSKERDQVDEKEPSL